MNAIDRQRQIHQHRIMTLGVRIRAERLDEETEGTDREAAAATLVAEHSEGDLDEALNFVKYLAVNATTDCPLCAGRGARQLATANGSESSDAVAATLNYEMCTCVRENARLKISARRAAAVPFKATSAPPSDLDKRIAAAEKVLADAQSAQTTACAETDKELAAIAPQVNAFAENRLVRDRALRDAREVVHTERKAIAMRDGQDDAEIETLREQLRLRIKERVERSARDEAALLEQREVANALEEELRHFDASREPLLREQAALEEKRRKLAGRYEQKIERQQKLLRRLHYLKPTATSGEEMAHEQSA